MNQVNTTQPLLPQSDRDQIALQRNVSALQNEYSTLFFLLQRLGLQQIVLDGFIAQNITVLAPTNATFARLNQQFVQFLLQPENEDLLRVILLYHLIPNTSSVLNAFSPNPTNPAFQAIAQDLTTNPRLSALFSFRDVSQVETISSGDVRFPLFIPINTLLIPPPVQPQVAAILERITNSNLRLPPPGSLSDMAPIGGNSKTATPRRIPPPPPFWANNSKISNNL
jgi:uncharacterized surface protein with fasciclin (FAS1) repeats